MKKQILSLMLGASILTESPLFAVEPPEDAPHKTAIKRTAPIYDSEKLDKLVESSMASLRGYKLLQRVRNNSLTEDKKINGTGNFQHFGQEPIVKILEHLPVNDVLKMFQLSKAMYKICDQDAVWELLGKKHGAPHLSHPTWCFKTSLSTWLYNRGHGSSSNESGLAIAEALGGSVGLTMASEPSLAS